jgi:adenine-specific DNA-methyltransferase
MISLSRLRERVASAASRVRAMQKKRSRNLRKNATEVEIRLWRYLRARRFESFKFRRQRPIGPYIVDFVCLERGLVIELDGGRHSESQDYDQRRDAYLERAGYRVVRFWNNDILQNIDGVLQTIDTELRRDPHPNPLPQAGEGDGTRVTSKRRDMRKARLAEIARKNPRMREPAS